MTVLLSEADIEAALANLREQVLAALPQDGSAAIIGIRTRGETIARRLYASLPDDVKVDLGILDITLYRDDLSRRRGVPLIRATEIDFDLDDRFVVLIDDVLQTGRSIRAALDALHDFGRPRAIRLGVLIDRGGRQLPIAADFVGTRLDVPDAQRIQVQLRENDGQEGADLVEKEG